MLDNITNYLTCFEAADCISKLRGTPISPVMIRKQCQAGRIKAQKIGRDWLIEQAEVEEYAKVKRGGWRPRKK